MNNPFHVTPPSARGPPNRFASSPRTGKLRRPFNDEKGFPSTDASGSRSLLRGPGVAARGVLRAAVPLFLREHLRDFFYQAGQAFFVMLEFADFAPLLVRLG